MGRTKATEALLAGKRLGKLEPKLQRLAELKAELEALSAEHDLITEEVVPVLMKLGKTHNLPDGTQFTATQAHRSYFDDAAIRKELGEELWAKVRKETMDAKKVEALITAGVIDAQMIAEHTEERPSKAYVLVTPPKSAGEAA